MFHAAVVVNDPGEDLLASTGLASDQDRQVGGRQADRGLEQLDRSWGAEHCVLVAKGQRSRPEVLFFIVGLGGCGSLNGGSDEVGDALDERHFVERSDIAELDTDRAVGATQMNAEYAIGAVFAACGDVGAVRGRTCSSISTRPSGTHSRAQTQSGGLGGRWSVRLRRIAVTSLRRRAAWAGSMSRRRTGTM